jgi:tetratricopeptide (TPR) repeat protein
LDPLARALAWLTFGLRQETLGDPQASLEAFEQAATFAPDSDIVHYFTGQEYIFLAQQVTEEAEAYEAEAEAALEDALRLNPDNARAQIGLGSVHFLRAQRLYFEVTAEAFEGDRAAGFAAIQEEAARALEAYNQVVGQPEQLDEYGVPVNSIARLGQAATLRLLADVAFRAGDPGAAQRHLDEAKATLEAAVAPLEEARDFRLLAHLYQTAGTVYQLEGFLLEPEDSAAAAEANRQALDYNERCIALEENFPFDTFMIERIINQFCKPYAEQLQGLLEGGS